MISRRGFFKAAGTIAAAIATAPLRPFASADPLTTIFAGESIPFTGQILWSMNLVVHSPRLTKQIYGIQE